MIILTMIFVLILLGLANFTFSITEKQCKTETTIWEPTSNEIIITNQNNAHNSQNQIVTEDYFYANGKLIANEQKIKILNKRLEKIENVVAGVVKQKLVDEQIDYEKIDFRLKVLEQDIDSIKKPKPIKKTFYGKKDDELEEKIRTLVFNSAKK